MKRSHPTPLIGLALAGIVAGYLMERGLAASGTAMIVPPVSLPVTLVVIAAIVVGFAVPIRRATHGKAKRRIDPFQALRVAVLAKASSLSGSLLAGGTFGILVYMLTLRVLPSTGSVAGAVAAVGGAVVLLIGGLVAEHMCVLPPDDPHGEEEHGTA